MNEITITVDERVLTALCDAALRGQGLNILQFANIVMSAVVQAKANGGPHVNGGLRATMSAEATRR
jgi:hypothetical protein